MSYTIYFDIKTVQSYPDGGPDGIFAFKEGFINLVHPAKIRKIGQKYIYSDHLSKVGPGGFQNSLYIL